MSTFEAAIPVIMKHEGGWVNDPVDPGGETNFGWSMATIKKLGLSAQDLGLPYSTLVPGCLKMMSKETAEKLYKKHFWNQGGYGNVVDQTVATKMMDAAVNMGPKRCAELAQRACNALGASLVVDGVLGEKSFAAINACNPEDFTRAFGDEMTAFYERIIIRNPALAKFRRNWLKRAAWGVVPRVAS